MPKVSVIVPVYKVEKYISQCIESILSQTFKDFELILVDDGSPDNSGKICDSYAQKDSRIQVIHKINGGVSSARNMGINNARGEYIMFVDSDDYIDPETIDTCIKAVGDKNYDCVIFGVEEFHLYKNQTIIRPVLKHICKDNCNIQKKLEEADKIGWLRGPVCKIFKRSVIIEHQLYFDTSMSYGEDTKFSFSYLTLCTTIIVLPKYFYHYCFRNKQSLTNQYLSWKYTVNLAKTLRYLRINFANEHNMEKTYYSYIQMVYASWMTNALSKLIISAEKDKKLIYLSIINDMKNDSFMKTYRPKWKQSRQYRLYMHFPLLWYYIVLFKKYVL